MGGCGRGVQGFVDFVSNYYLNLPFSVHFRPILDLFDLANIYIINLQVKKWLGPTQPLPRLRARGVTSGAAPESASDFNYFNP